MIPRAEHLIAAGVKPETAEYWLPAVQSACEEFEIDTPRRIAAFVAQCAHESAGFRLVLENLNYNAEALVRVWPRLFPNLQMAMAYHRKPEKIANRAYGNRMGNGPEHTGDGWRYRGRGLKQLTGRYNYTKCSQGLGVDFVSSPDLLLQPAHAARSAGWFWSSNQCAALADAGEFILLTKRINGGLMGLSDRQARYAKVLAAIPQTSIVA